MILSRQRKSRFDSLINWAIASNCVYWSRNIPYLPNNDYVSSFDIEIKKDKQKKKCNKTKRNETFNIYIDDILSFPSTPEGTMNMTKRNTKVSV